MESEDQKEKLKQAIEEQKKLFKETCEKIEYKAVDDNRHSFKFKDKEYIFRIPTLKEEFKIELIQSDITDVPGIQKTGPADYLINRLGNMDLICMAKVLTHTAILFDNKPDDFDPDKLSKGERRDLGFYIFVSEISFIEDKKKQSTDDQ